MADTPPLDMSSLTLLAEALADLRKGSQSAFVVKMAGALMDRVLEEHPGITSLPDGRSILVEAYLAEASLGVSWWQKRGEHAWLPTPDTPYPLLGVVSATDRAWGAPSFRKISVQEHGALVAMAFFRDALAHAMPLRHEEVAQWDPRKALDGRQRSLLVQQKNLLEYCFFDTYPDDLPVKKKIAALVEAGGALPISGLQAKHYGAFVGANAQHLRARVIVQANFGARFTEQVPAVEAFWRHWWREPDYDSGRHVRAAMKKEKFEREAISKVEDFLFVHEVVAAGGEMGKTKPAQAWHDVVAQVERRKDGWTSGDEQGLAWHQALAARPDMLTHALADARVDWTLADQGGRGPWHHLAGAVVNGKAEASLKRLAKRLDPVLPDGATPVLWRSWPWGQNHCQGLMEATINAHPRFWLGTGKQQQEGMVRTIEAWLMTDPRQSSGTTNSLNALFDPVVDRAHYSDEVLFAMHILGRIAKACPEAGEHLPLARDNPVLHPPSCPKFAKQLHAAFLRKSVDRHIRAEAEAANMDTTSLEAGNQVATAPRRRL